MTALRTDRSARRAFSRDAARQHARPGTNTATVPNVAAVVHGRHPMPHRIVTPKSGKLRGNTKRNARAAFWAEERRTVLVRVSVDMFAAFREHLHLLGDRAKIHTATPNRDSAPLDFDVHWLDLAVHIPGAPAAAVRAEPTWWSEWSDELQHHSIRIHYVDWRDAAGNRITAEAGSLVSA